MKTPCPAFLLEASRSPLLPAVLVRPCRVLFVHQDKQTATIQVHSLTLARPVTRYNVPLADLPTTADAAVAEMRKRITLLPTLAEKSALFKMAGASVG